MAEPLAADQPILTQVVVGSRLHGLENEASDWDYRGIFINPLRNIVSPFQKTVNTQWFEGDQDNTAYELGEFCKFAVNGNATILEVFFSDQVIVDSAAAEEMRANWQKFMDTDGFVKASLGYATNNKNKFEERSPVGVKGQFRRHKFAIAYCRVLWQCREFLTTGEFKCRIDEGEFKEKLLRWKNDWDDSFTMEAIATYYQLEAEVLDAWETTEFKFKPDLAWIEDFIYRTYLTYGIEATTPTATADYSLSELIDMGADDDVIAAAYLRKKHK